MSFQWMAVAGFLYFEIGLCAILMLPFISATRWQKIFRSNFLGFFRSYANLYFNIFIVVLLILFADSVKDIMRYGQVSAEAPDLSNNPMAESVNNMKLFRAQRNFYIAGFALFLFVVLRKLVTMISAQAQLSADCAASKKQAESATLVAQKLLDEKDNEAGDKQKTQSESEEAVTSSQDRVNELLEELEKARTDLAAMKKQAESTNAEYDRLLAEHAKLQKEVSTGDKKDD